MADITELQRKLNEQGPAVLLDDKDIAEIERKLTQVYLQNSDSERGEEIEDIEGILTDSEFQKLLQKKNIKDIDLSYSGDEINITIDRDLSELGPYNADAVIDGYYSKLGRLGSEVAQLALDGKKIAVINAEYIVRTGSEEDLISDYQKRREIGSDSGPDYPKRPDKIVKRAIRPMIPYKKKRGQKALSNIRIYLGNPYDGEGQMWNSQISTNVYYTKKFMTIGEIAEKIGWKGSQ